MIDRGRAAQCALLALAAENMYDGIGLAPPLDDAIASAWTLIGHFTAADALFGAQAVGLGQRVYYGFLARAVADPTQVVAVIRGTKSVVEWLENIEGLLIPTQYGEVEQGFWSIYQSMTFVHANPAAIGARSAALNVAGILDRGSSLTVIGHSLGAALATYFLAEIIACTMAREFAVSGALFASPRPGNAAFVRNVDALVGADHYESFAYIRDIVVHVPPSLPFGLGFQSLPNTQWITPATGQATIHNDPLCNHHPSSYAALIFAASVQPNGCVLSSPAGTTP